jgi:PAS domain S-box-containing protein
MEISQQIEAVYRRALLLRQYAVESPVQQDLLGKALQELYFVLEELQASEEELRQQNQELVATQQAVELERKRYQTLFEFAPNGYLVTDLQGTIHQANHYAAAQLFCIPQEYLINKPLLVFVHEPDRDRFQAQLATLGPRQDWKVSLSPRNGALILVSIAVTRIQDTQQQRGMLLWSLYDITSRQEG